MTDPAAPLDAGAAEAGRSAEAAVLSATERGVLLAVLYAELFDYPLRIGEIAERAVGPIAPDQAERVVAALEGRYLDRCGEWVTWVGRTELIAIREQRMVISQRLRQEAVRFGRQLRWIPFVRTAGVCGSLAVDNAGEDGDVDLFCLTAEDRLWVAHAGVMSLRRIAAILSRLRRRSRPSFCPNYLLTLSSLQLDEHNLYTAHEVSQAVPLWGDAGYRAFLAANDWVRRFLPNLPGRGRLGAWSAPEAEGPQEPTRQPHRPWAVRSLEWVLGGRLGALIDRGLHRLLLRYYGWRLEARGVERSEIASSYRRDRQRVVGGGFKAAVERRFRSLVLDRLGATHEAGELERLFPAPASEPGVDLYRRLFAARYGQSDG